ncbi:clustered mitochondria protein-like [Heracleum sosnowskyi]|uniref:Clustered mitochondria protein-like n=1 Tax=Heracleum sosnowskyi TaxID=360622 RepID=A0AAD8NB71_9APIA|nr:clustered mitochondria protein-like [Heracleum sosnowskyi]
MHREVANCCRYLAMVLYHAGDMAGAIMQQHRELIINERCLGLDHPDTAHSYGNMALFYHGLNQTELALRHMSRALLLLGLSSGPDHPDVAATFINVAMMYQDTGKMNTALRYLQEALTKNERLLGEEHIQTAVCYHALAIAFNCMGAFKLSHHHEKRTYDILVKQLGEEDSRSRDSQNWMNTFKMRELQMTAQKQKGQTLNAASTQKAIDILKHILIWYTRFKLRLHLILLLPTKP